MFSSAFTLLSRAAHAPVKDARIRLLRDHQLQYLSDTNFSNMIPIHTTDATGSTSVSVMCGAGGSMGLFSKTGRFVISHELLVEADGYRPLSTGLANVVGGHRWPLSKRVFDVPLVLFKNRIP